MKGHGSHCTSEVKTMDVLGPEWSKGHHHKTSKHPHGVGHKKGRKKRGGGKMMGESPAIERAEKKKGYY